MSNVWTGAAITTLWGISASASIGTDPIQVPPDVTAQRLCLAQRLDALAQSETSLTAPICGDRMAQWNNWNNLWNNVAWLNWKNF